MSFQQVIRLFLLPRGQDPVDLDQRVAKAALELERSRRNNRGVTKLLDDLLRSTAHH